MTTEINHGDRVAFYIDSSRGTGTVRNVEGQALSVESDHWSIFPNRIFLIHRKACRKLVKKSPTIFWLVKNGRLFEFLQKPPAPDVRHKFHKLKLIE